jgi:pimeloyl-ACP methyl ester carboxylesterase
VEAIADYLGIERFSVVGRSGGGPHALACAALLCSRVARTATLVSVAPPDALGLDWMAGMADGNIEAYASSGADTAAFAADLRSRAESVLNNPDSLLDDLRAEMTDPDLRVVNDVGIRRTLAATYAEALKYGADGWLDDMMALRTGWNFEFDDVRCPMLLWHGADDNFSPVSHTHWLRKRIPQAEMRIEAGAAHFGAVKVLLKIFDWLTDWRDEARDLAVEAPAAEAPAAERYAAAGAILSHG